MKQIKVVSSIGMLVVLVGTLFMMTGCGNKPFNYFGDSMSDLKCAEAMGLKFYGINFGENAIRDLFCLSTLI